MKKQKRPGENISLKTKKNESDAVMDWINSQSNLMDSIRYLIENEIRLNGVRNLQHFIPSDRPMLAAAWTASRLETAAASEQVADGMPAHAQDAAQAPINEAESGRNEADEIDDEDIESWL
ncbi:hypothetical protein FE783_19050 [Paenibacillus mesophilus]|uniref:hypothetical protein n=1 Tax=Paenibacillus mesophilus TaxID=2582849 RepID=UPI00110F4576|nr:hypothetical protein [Paenibacillus mesophilus]TMV48057.1 hypothetical protein FE783_19050 [Paenibacillus mesophilus]